MFSLKSAVVTLINHASQDFYGETTQMCLDHGMACTCIYIDLRNASCLILTNGQHWERDGGRQKPELLHYWICWLSSANQNVHPKHLIVFSHRYTLLDTYSVFASMENYGCQTCVVLYLFFKRHRISFISIIFIFVSSKTNKKELI